MITAMKVLSVRKGLPIREVARNAEMDEGTLYNFSKGKCILPERHRDRVAQILGVTVSEICDGNGWPVLEE